MKNIKKKVWTTVSILLAILIGSVGVYAWQTTANTGKYRSVGVGVGTVDATNYILISESPDSQERLTEYTANLPSQMNMMPVTTNNLPTFRWEDGTILDSYARSANVYSHSIYLSSNVKYNRVSVSDIKLTGSGSTKAIADSLRVGIIAVGGGSHIYNPKDIDSFAFTASNLQSSPVMFNIYIWFEVTDPSCNYDNAMAYSGEIVVEITFEGYWE